MRVINALKDGRSLRWGLFSAIAAGVAFPVIQTGFFQNSFSSWFLSLIKSPFTSFLYFIFLILFGSLISLQVYISKNRKLCRSCNLKSGRRTGALGLLLGLFVGVCPACIGLIGLIAPLGLSLTLTYYGWAFILASILILLFSMHMLGGFSKD